MINQSKKYDCFSRRKLMLLFLCSVCLWGGASVATTNQEEKFNYAPPAGVVPDEATAIRIAEAILFPIYGEDKIISERPFKANLREGVWVVVGTLPSEMHGGVAEVEISKTNGAIMRISHGQ